MSLFSAISNKVDAAVAELKAAIAPAPAADNTAVLAAIAALEAKFDAQFPAGE